MQQAVGITVSGLRGSTGDLWNPKNASSHIPAPSFSQAETSLKNRQNIFDFQTSDLESEDRLWGGWTVLGTEDLRRNSVKPLKGRREVVGVLESHVSGHLFDLLVSFPQEYRSLLHATLFQVRYRSEPEPRLECATEVVAAHPGGAGEILDGERPKELGGDPDADPIQGIGPRSVSSKVSRNSAAQRVEVNRFVQKVIGLRPDSPEQILPTAISREHENRGSSSFAEAWQKLQAVPIAQHEIEDDQIRLVCLQEGESGLPVCGATDMIQGRQGRAQGLDQRGIIINDQDSLPMHLLSPHSKADTNLVKRT